MARENRHDLLVILALSGEVSKRGGQHEGIDSGLQESGTKNKELLKTRVVAKRSSLAFAVKQRWPTKYGAAPVFAAGAQ
jgi:hypothetical protein